MAFRWLFLITIALMVINIDALILGDQLVGGSVEGAGPGGLAEKACLLVTGLVFVGTRPRSWLNLGLLATIVAVTFLSATMTHYLGFDWSRYFRSVVTLVSALLLLMASPDPADQRWILSVVAFAPLASVGIAAVYAAASIHSAFMTDTVGVLRLQASTASPAWIGALAALALFCSVRLADIASPRFFLLAGANGLILMLTAARTPLAAGVVMAGAALLEGFRGQSGRKLLAIGLSLVALTATMSVFGEQIYMRFTESGSNGRDVLWESVGPAMRAFPDWGIGLGHQPEALPLEVAREAETFALHNEYKRLMLEIGVVPAFLVFVFLLCMQVRQLVMEDIELPLTFMASLAAFALYCYSDNAFSVPMIFLLLPIAVVGTKHAAARDAEAALDEPAYGPAPVLSER